MTPPVWQVLSNTPPLQALVALKIYPGGQASDGAALPYVTWQIVGGSPENCLADPPEVDMFSVQFDCWADDVAEARAVAQAVRDAIQTQSHIVAWRGEDRDPATGAYRYSFDADWFTFR